MKNVESVVASTSAIAASALGLAFVCSPLPPPHDNTKGQQRERQRAVSTPLSNMTSTETYTLSSPQQFFPSSPASFSPAAFTFSVPSPITNGGDRRALSSGGATDLSLLSTGQPRTQDGKRSLKRRLQARDTTSLGTHALLGANAEAQPSQTTWMKRLSTFSSHSGSHTSSPQAPSTAVSQSNGSVAFSNAGSTTPMFPSFTPATVPPNKLVKRTSSIRSNKGSSRIPLPTFRRPATSHDRDANLQDYHRRPSTASLGINPAQSANGGVEAAWKPYFTPTLSFIASTALGPRRDSTSIPNPVKRAHADRQHRPLLVSAGDTIQPVGMQFDMESKEDLAPPLTVRKPSLRFRSGRRFFSSPLPQRPSTASSNTSASITRFLPTTGSQGNSGDDASARNSMLSLGRNEPPNSSPLVHSRSFSPIIPTPQTLPPWKRPAKTHLSEGRTRRNVSSPAMSPELGSATRGNAAVENERPAKRREVAGGHSSPMQGPPLLDRDMQYTVTTTSPGQTKTLRAFASNGTADLRQTYVEHSSPRLNGTPGTSPAISSRRARSARQSLAASESSTFAGSDSDARYNEDDEGFDSPNETFFDSVRTRATSTGSNAARGTHLEAMFENTLPTQPESSPSSLTLSHMNKFSKGPFERPRHSIIEEEESVSTPVRSVHNSSAHASPETFRFAASPDRHIGSSPPELPFSFCRQGQNSQTGLGINDDVEMWDSDERDYRLPRWSADEDQPQLAEGSPLVTAPHGRHSEATLQASGERPAEARSNIFDWSEQQERTLAGQSPPRPRTVHGKKDAEARGSRPARRAPSGLHVRSQSVPVVPESDAKKSQVMTNKFGTWGVGSKGVTEDWDEDFDFEEPVPAIPAELMEQETRDALIVQGQPVLRSREPSGSMRVPEKIQKQQEIVMANIGLLRDWGLLIEELKELRLRASSLHISADAGKTWVDVEAMIDLADQETHDATLQPRSSPPSSPTFDFADFDEPAVPPFVRHSPRVVPRVHAEDIFGPPSPSPARKNVEMVRKPNRPRKDSEAVARSVIEMLQRQGNGPGASSDDGGPAKKVPFDTATLRRIVPWVQELRDKAKRSIRDAENLYNSPLLGQGTEPPFATIQTRPASVAAPSMTRLNAQSDSSQAASRLSFAARTASVVQQGAESWDADTSIAMPVPTRPIQLQPHTPRRESGSAASPNDELEASNFFHGTNSPSHSPPDDLPRRMELMTMG